MLKKNKTSRGIKVPSRRKFFKAAAATGAAAAATMAMPNIAMGAPVTLKMQAAWPAGKNIFFEMAKDYEKRVNEMAGGSMKLEVLPKGAVVKTKEITEKKPGFIFFRFFGFLGFFGFFGLRRIWQSPGFLPLHMLLDSICC